MTIKLKFQHQDFQTKAVNAVCNIFYGQEELSSLNTNTDITLTDSELLENLRAVQKSGNLEQSQELEGHNFTVEMETGTGKTYTYIKTIYELNSRYGWSKFIIVVPSIAIREGVLKAFQMTEEHFVSDYQKRAGYFVYDSGNLSKLRYFVNDEGINIMIINSQAFNSKDTRRIRMEYDNFGSRRPIDEIANARPILIIDEPQSVEGEKTREALKEFRPLFTLRYSATPREKYNLVYRLDAVDAFEQNLVKKIHVTGISIGNVSATGGYVYLKGIIRSSNDPVAMIEFDRMSSSGIKRITRNLREGSDLFELSHGLEEYRTGYILRTIDGLHGSIEFLNGQKVYSGEIIGSCDEQQIRRIQIRETIEAHLRKERQLYSRGIKVLSLFFIDEVAKYRQYDDENNPVNGTYAKIFEEEYIDAVKNFRVDERYSGYLDSIDVSRTHAGYFSIDKHNRMTDSKINKREGTSDDVSAFDLIMKDKERLLSIGEPVRFIFSHSALREGWDNPNVFQICTLKNSTSDIRKRQEVGRGLRLCVNQEGDRITEDGINELNIIASESYKDFAAGLQQEFADSVGKRAQSIDIADARKNNITIRLNKERLSSPEFWELWRRINRKTIWRVEFSEEDFVHQVSRALDEGLNIAHVVVNIEHGVMSGLEFSRNSHRTVIASGSGSIVRYDLVGRLAGLTGLTRRTVVNILKSSAKFSMFRINPEMFIAQASEIITHCKQSFTVKYEPIPEEYSTEIFSNIVLRNMSESSLASTPQRGLYDYALCDSKTEKDFADGLDTCSDVALFTKLPASYMIDTPAGKYIPDWAITFRDRIYFVAETKGSVDPTQLRASESMKVKCAREHFRAIGEGLKYEVVDNISALINFSINKT